MAVLTAKARARVPSSEFGLPGEEKYPMPDMNHVNNALSRSSQMENAGKLSSSQHAQIVAKAHSRARALRGQ